MKKSRFSEEQGSGWAARDWREHLPLHTTGNHGHFRCSSLALNSREMSPVASGWHVRVAVKG